MKNEKVKMQNFGMRSPRYRYGEAGFAHFTFWIVIFNFGI